MVVGAIVADRLPAGACPGRCLQRGRSGIAQVEDTAPLEVLTVEVAGGYGATAAELGEERAGGVAPVYEHERPVRRGAGMQPQLCYVHASGLEAVPDLRAGRVVADGTDEGGAAAKPGDGHHGGRGHAAALQRAVVDGDLLLGAGDAFEQQ